MAHPTIAPSYIYNFLLDALFGQLKLNCPLLLIWSIFLMLVFEMLLFLLDDVVDVI